MNGGNTSTEAIIKDQAIHHRKTLSANTRTKRAQPRPPFKHSQKKERQLEGHEQLLKMLQDGNRPASFFVTDGAKHCCQSDELRSLHDYIAS